LEIVPTPSGEASARTSDGKLLHSSRAPREEATRLAAAAIAPGDDIVVILGFGLGYSAEACFDAGLERVLVLESSAASLRAALEIRELDRLVSREGLAFIVGGDPEAAISALELSGAVRAALIRTKLRVDAEPAWYGRAAAAVERWNAKGAVNEATLRRFGKLWVRNLSRNLELSATESGVDELLGVAAGIPALVLAAGPSLDLCLPRLRELARKAVLVCVDTALRSVLGAGVQPDIVVLVDPQYWNWRHVAGLDSPRSILVSESAAWPAAFRKPWRRIYLGGSLFPLGRMIESIAGSKGSLGAGGSVATSAWDLARLMGCSPIWMAGLDLGFPAGGTHARASFFEQRALASGHRLNPAETAQAGALQGSGGFDGPAAGGGTIRTDKRMALYAWWFESRLARP
ncbi:MAG: DUF115 domain-containing protein, partial [Spirochaetaceae bacterium]|nr:DUF115 domain-containing protein [Spirochaetaceae bacterium]